MKGFRHLFCFSILLLIINGIRAVPVQVSDVKVNDEVSKNVVTAENENRAERKRVGRQNVRILMDPVEYDEIEEDVRRMNKPPIVVAEPIMPKKRPVGMFGVVSSLLGSSSSGSSKDIRTTEAIARVRRQVEQIVDTMKKNLNQTKSQKQEIEESTEDSMAKPTENGDSDSDEDEDEPPGGGDGMGGGILGLLAGLFGEGGQSDLGTLLTTVGSIVANLSGGEGFDLNTVIGAAVGVLAGILGGDGMQRIGMAIGGYLVTALEGITGGGAMNNGQFFGDLTATLLGGLSAAGGGSEEGGGSDSGTFFLSLLSALFGGSSKSSK